MVLTFNITSPSSSYTCLFVAITPFSYSAYIMTQSINNVVLTFNITSPNSSYPSLFIASTYNTSSHIPPSVTTSFSNSTYCQESNKILVSFIMHIPCLSICFIFFSFLANSLSFFFLPSMLLFLSLVHLSLAIFLSFLNS